MTRPFFAAEADAGASSDAGSSPCRYVRIVCAYSGCSASESTTLERLVTRRAMSTASAAALAPSYIEAFAVGSPKSSDTTVWNSKMACSVPCATSAWYGVYAVRNSPRSRS